MHTYWIIRIFSRLQPSVWKCILTPPIWKVSHSFRLIMWSVCLVSPFTESAAAWHWARCMILCTLGNGQWSIWVIEVIRNSPSDISVIGQEDWVISWVMAAIHQWFSNLRLHLQSRFGFSCSFVKFWVTWGYVRSQGSCDEKKLVEYLVLGRNVSPFHEILSSVAVCLEVKLLLSV